MRREPLAASEVSEMVQGLNRLARNLWWTWNQEPQEIFQELSPRGWQNLYHNTVAVLHEVSDYELRIRLQDPVFADRVRYALKGFNDYMKDTDTWGKANAPALLRNPVAYFSAEFGFHETLPIAAGGDGQRFVEAKLGAEIGHRIPEQRRRVGLAPGVGVLHVIVEALKGVAHPVGKHGILQTNSQLVIRNLVQHGHGIVVKVLPAAGRQFLEDFLRFLVPGPPKVPREAVQPLDHFGHFTRSEWFSSHSSPCAKQRGCHPLLAGEP